MQGVNYEPEINLEGLEARSKPKGHREMLFALVLVLTALILLVVRYRTFWFDSLTILGTTTSVSSETVQETAKPVSPAPARKTGVKQHATSASEAEATASTAVPQPLLAPLKVDVTYANGRHQTLVARDLAVRLSFSSETAEALLRPVEPVYPLLAQQSNLQGSVVVIARIGNDGGVESVQVVSGPEILASAAVEAVKQWRFKPHVEGGKPIPSETRITVNFTISTP
jgi:TonB family protein